MSSVVSKVSKKTALFGGIILFSAAIITTYDVMCRFIFNSPTSWALEIAQYSLLYATFLGGAYAFLEDSYTRVEVITNLLPKRVQRGLYIIGDIVTVILFVILAWHSSKFTLLCFTKGWLESTPLKTPMWIPLIIIPIGCTMMAVQNMLIPFVNRGLKLGLPPLGNKQK